MNNRDYRPIYTPRHHKLWIYFLPVVGIVPAVWTLYRKKGDRESQKASRVSLNLVLIWLCSYSLLSLGATNASGIMSFRLLYANAILTTTYFVACTVMMSRLGNKTNSDKSP